MGNHTYIRLRNNNKCSISCAQQTKSFGVITNENKSWSMEPPKYYGGKAMSENMFKVFFLRKVAIVSTYFIIIRCCFQIVVAATEKPRLPLFSLDLGTKMCLETDYLKSPSDIIDQIIALDYMKNGIVIVNIFHDYNFSDRVIP